MARLNQADKRGLRDEKEENIRPPPKKKRESTTTSAAADFVDVYYAVTSTVTSEQAAIIPHPQRKKLPPWNELSRPEEVVGPKKIRIAVRSQIPVFYQEKDKIKTEKALVLDIRELQQEDQVKVFLLIAWSYPSSEVRKYVSRKSTKGPMFSNHLGVILLGNVAPKQRGMDMIPLEDILFIGPGGTAAVVSVNEVGWFPADEAEKQLVRELNNTTKNKAKVKQAQTDAQDDDDEDMNPGGKGENNDSDDDIEEEELKYKVDIKKWQEYPKDVNTLESKNNLRRPSRQILAANHKKNGGLPQPSVKRGKAKQSLRTLVPSEEPPASKPQKLNFAKQPEEGDSWLPEGDDWEADVDKVETIERDKETDQLMAIILYKNGKKSKISMDQVERHCPRPMVKFCVARLNFQ